MSLHHSIGETRKETVSQGGGVFVSLSGGDERSEPESAIGNPASIISLTRFRSCQVNQSTAEKHNR